MSRKTLNKANLERLGAPKLADLVMGLVQGSAALQRRARMELSAAQGPQGFDRGSAQAVCISASVAKLCRLAQAACAGQGSQQPVGPDRDGDRAAECRRGVRASLAFLKLAPSTHERTDDSNGSVGDVFGQAVTIIGQVAPRVTINKQTLAERIPDTVAMRAMANLKASSRRRQRHLARKGRSISN